MFKKLKKAFSRLSEYGFKTSFELIWYKLALRLPLKNAVVLECESDMDDNPRAFYEYLIENRYNRKYKLIWIVKDVEFCKKKHKNKNVVFLSRSAKRLSDRLRLRYHLATAKWFIFSHPYWFRKRREKQTVIHIGHGTPIKQASKTFDAGCIDLLAVPSKDILDWYTRFWRCEEEKTFICGQPRNDLLFVGNDKKSDILSKVIPEYRSEKIIMCMPTYRQAATWTDSETLDPYSLSVVKTEEELVKLDKALFDAETHLIVKIHPLQKTDSMKMPHLRNIHYIQNKDLLYKDVLLYEFLGCCDALVTDISSVVFDFLLLDRPVAFFMNHFDGYSRGYLLDDPLEFMPGKKMNTLDDLISFVTKLDVDDGFSAERESVCAYVNGADARDRCFSEDLCAYLFNTKRGNKE